VPQYDFTNGVLEYYDPNQVMNYNVGGGYPVFEYYTDGSNNYYETQTTPYVFDNNQMNVNMMPTMNVNQIMMNNLNQTNTTTKVVESDEKNSKKRQNSVSSSNISKRPRKKRKVELDVDLDPTSENYKVTLSRDELLNLTSKQFEDYVKQLEGNKKLSDEEKRELKRQRRLIKNRESAQASRQRKKSHVDDLEKKVMNLTKENSDLFHKVTNLTKENEQLKTEVTYLQNMISKSGFMDLISTGVKKVKSLQNDVKSSSVKTTGIAFCVLLFTFGFLFNFQIESDPFTNNVNENMPGIIPGRLFSEENNDEFKLTSNNKPLFDILAQIPDYSNKRLEETYKKKSYDVKEKFITLQRSENEQQEIKNTKNPTLYAVKLPSSNTTYLICDYNSTLKFEGLPSLPPSNHKPPENEEKDMK